MKSISAAVVIAAGVFGMVKTMPTPIPTVFGQQVAVAHQTVPLVGFATSLVIIALGLVGWWAALKYDR